MPTILQIHWNHQTTTITTTIGYLRVRRSIRNMIYWKEIIFRKPFSCRSSWKHHHLWIFCSYCWRNFFVALTNEWFKKFRQQLIPVIYYNVTIFLNTTTPIYIINVNIISDEGLFIYFNPCWTKDKDIWTHAYRKSSIKPFIWPA